MTELIYSIDKEASNLHNCLVIRILAAERQNLAFNPLPTQPLLTRNRLNLLSTPKDTSLLPFLIDEETQYLKRTAKQLIDSALTPLHLIHIPPRSTHQAFKLLSMTGKVFFESKPIAIDLHTAATFRYQAINVDGITKAIGEITLSSETIPLTDCRFVGNGAPSFFIKGASLKFLSNDVPWNDLKEAFRKICRPLPDLIEEAKEDEDAPRVILTGIDTVPAAQAPLPVLTLKDRTGAFADLSMAYGDSIVPFSSHGLPQQPHQKGLRRDAAVEAAWEKDLLETDFIRKPAHNSSYYCPMDKVAKSLAFLLEIGWEVRDWQGRRVMLQTGTQLEAFQQDDSVAFKGKISYGAFEADLKDIIGAFNRRERFAQIAPGHVALLPAGFEKDGLDILADDATLEGDLLKMHKRQIGAFKSVLEHNKDIKCSNDLAELKNRLASFERIDATLPGNAFKGALRHYQQSGLSWLCFLRDFGFNGMLADDMGLGKTVQVMAFLSTQPLHGPSLIIVPTSLLFNWKKEFETFLPSYPIMLHHGTARTRNVNDLDTSHVIITSYSIARQDASLLRQLNYQYLILDEAQAVKNASTQSFQAIASLSSSFRLSITGTPIENHLMELWAHFHLLMPDLLGKESTFNAEVQAGASDPRFLRRIQRKIRPFLLRRTKEEVAKDLPEKIEQTVWVEMGEQQRTLYESYLTGVRRNLLDKVEQDGIGKHRMEVLEAIMRLKQICCHPHLVEGEWQGECPKLDLLFDDIETIVEEGKKVLVYSQFTTMLKAMARIVTERGWKAAYLDGATRDRQSPVELFQNDPEVQIFLISLKAGGVGLNLTAADYVFLYDPWWNNAAENQAIDRAHRIGRKETVIAKRFVTAESIEEKIMKLKAAKSAIAASLLDDAAAAEGLTADDLLYLLQS